MKLNLNALSLALLTAGLLAGCGGGGDTAASSTSASTADAPKTAPSGNAETGGQVVNAEALEAGADYNGFIVTFRDGSVEGAQASQVTPASTSGLVRALSEASQGDATVRPLGVANTSVVQTARTLQAREAATVMRKLAAAPNVVSVEPNLIGGAAARPNDPLYAQQWYHMNTRAGTNAESAWDLSIGSGVTVAVIDSDIYPTPDLQPNMVPGYDFADYDADPTGYTCRHGTHVAGTVAAVGNNGTGMAGTAYGAKIMPVRVLNGIDCSFQTSDLVNSVTWASGGAVAGVPTLTPGSVPQVINMSLQYGLQGTCSPALQAAIDGAISRGVTVVVAAGNHGYPIATANLANCRGVLPVVATDVNAQGASWSNHDTTKRVALAAPGVNILSTLPGSSTYDVMSGTSMAAPQVSGVVALMQSRRKALGLAPLTHVQAVAILKNTSRWMADCQGCGTGLLNARAAVEAATLPATSPRMPVYHHYNHSQGWHVYTTTANEIAPGNGWITVLDVGFLDSAQTLGSLPLHRYWNPGSGDHFYSTNIFEINGNPQWRYEGVTGYCKTGAEPGTTPLHRYYNPGLGDHYYTPNFNQFGYGSQGFAYEGIACHVYTGSR